MVSDLRALAAKVQERGFSLNGLLVHDWSWELSRSELSPEGFGRYSLDLTLHADGQKLLGWKGAAASARLKQHIQEFSDGDDLQQLYSNIDAPSRTSLYELWLEQRWDGQKFRIKGGKIDSNSDFAVVQGAGDFLNSSMGYSPTIVAFPTYPEPKPGLVGSFQPVRRAVITAGNFWTGSCGNLLLVEPGWKWATHGDLDGRASVGSWYLIGPADRSDGRAAGSAYGFYSVVEQSLWRKPLARQDANRSLSSFLQLGRTPDRAGKYPFHLGGGLVLQAPFARRPGDSTGLAGTWVRMQPGGTEVSLAKEELIIESYYNLSLAKHLALIQDLQFVHSPGSPSDDGPILTLRAMYSF